MLFCFFTSMNTFYDNNTFLFWCFESLMSCICTSVPQKCITHQKHSDLGDINSFITMNMASKKSCLKKKKSYIYLYSAIQYAIGVGNEENCMARHGKKNYDDNPESIRGEIDSNIYFRGKLFGFRPLKRQYFQELI